MNIDIAENPYDLGNMIITDLVKSRTTSNNYFRLAVRNFFEKYSLDRSSAQELLSNIQNLPQEEEETRRRIIEVLGNMNENKSKPQQLIDALEPIISDAEEFREACKDELRKLFPHLLIGVNGKERIKSIETDKEEDAGSVLIREMLALKSLTPQQVSARTAIIKVLCDA